MVTAFAGHNRRLLLAFPLFFLIVAGGIAHAAALPGQVDQRAEAMTLGQAAVLGLVEGVTEYLPVSSTGHLLLAERALGIGKSTSGSAEVRERTREALDAYTICIQAGAIFAVLGLYFGRVMQMFRGVAGRDAEGRRILINVIAGFLPAAVIGLLFNKAIKAYLFGPWPVVVAWVAGGLAILVVSWWRQRQSRAVRQGLQLGGLTWKMALFIGVAQCIAMWPGVSRSLVTICGGLLVGLSMAAAVEYSFLLGLVTLGAATAYDGLKHGQLMLQTFDSRALAVGLIFAFLAAVISVKWMVSYLNRHGLAVFGYYRVALGLTVGLLIVNHLL